MRGIRLNGRAAHRNIAYVIDCYFGNTESMAAKDHEGYQQFPNASDTVPNQVVLEEEIELKLSLLEGHQSVGESEEDPYNKAVRYLEEHHIIEIFQVQNGFPHWPFEILPFFYTEHCFTDSLPPTKGSSTIHAGRN